jgi:ssRNA-specific RNase YbeY (16S rRNA maturation enzyme)
MSVISHLGSANVVSKLCRTNIYILQQKVDLIKTLETKHGMDHLRDFVYKESCPIIRASIGQHIRHSIDHMERVTDVVSVNLVEGHDMGNSFKMVAIPYDVRERNTEDESNVTVALERISRIRNELEQFKVKAAYIDTKQPVLSTFILSVSAVNSEEMSVPSTISRELAFMAHHAIHHLAIIQLIATNPKIGGLVESELPPNFGRAASTIELIDSATYQHNMILNKYKE